MKKKKDFKLEEIKIEDINPVTSDAEYDQIELLNAYESLQQEYNEKVKEYEDMIKTYEFDYDVLKSKADDLSKSLEDSTHELDIERHLRIEAQENYHTLVELIHIVFRRK